MQVCWLNKLTKKDFGCAYKPHNITQADIIPYWSPYIKTWAAHTDIDICLRIELHTNHNFVNLSVEAGLVSTAENSFMRYAYSIFNREEGNVH